jgi:ArsR family transcriptional regulator, arsenate/arsenite/antimonite-responsive transcriptional repressor
MKRVEISIFTALADPTRRAILRLLRSESKTAGELASAFDLSKPTLSHHFQVLRESGLVRSERRGTRVVYTLQANALEELLAELMELTDGARERARKPRTRGGRP